VEEFATVIVKNFYENEVIQEISVHEKGFIRIKLTAHLI
jgi:hypothetical protein